MTFIKFSVNIKEAAFYCVKMTVASEIEGIEDRFVIIKAKSHEDAYLRNLDQGVWQKKKLETKKQIWQFKNDSSIVLTLLENTILNITVSFMKPIEKDSISKIASDKFGVDGILKAYEENHPLQSYITYWNL